VKFLLDHDVADQVSGVLRRAGHSVLFLRDVLSMRTKDPDVVGYALEAGAIVITCNRDDYLEVCTAREHYGVIILIRRKTRIGECSAVLRLVERAGEAGLVRNINFA
jgi:predicted nuclease of predicted toxin-antitoxin system